LTLCFTPDFQGADWLEIRTIVPYLGAVALPIPNDQEEGQRIISPFAQTTATIHPHGAHHSRTWIFWTLTALAIVVVLAVVGYFVESYLNDPYRTLEPFPVDKYMSDYRSLAGSKFKADVKVSADLGWKAEVGRLMVFTIGTDSRPVVVLIPPRLAGIFFTKGQNYQTSLEVGEGGLIYADSCEKD
jgi:hypothetical protein